MKCRLCVDLVAKNLGVCWVEFVVSREMWLRAMERGDNKCIFCLDYVLLVSGLLHKIIIIAICIACEWLVA